MKRAFALFLALSLTACLPTGEDSGDTTASSSSSSLSSVSSAPSSSSSSSSSTATSSASSDDDVSGDTRVITVTVDSWSFSPATITAKKGEKVELKLVGKTGVHGFAIPGLGINVPISVGETKMVTLPTDEEGTYEFLCNIPCGSGHTDMRGSIVIEP